MVQVESDALRSKNVGTYPQKRAGAPQPVSSNVTPPTPSSSSSSAPSLSSSDSIGEGSEVELGGELEGAGAVGSMSKMLSVMMRTHLARSGQTYIYMEHMHTLNHYSEP